MTGLLALGSVVELDGAEAQRFMVLGYYPEKDDTSYDYLLTLYPQGMFEFPHLVMANEDAISVVLFSGYEDAESRGILDAAQELMNLRAETNRGIVEETVRFSKENPDEFRRLLSRIAKQGKVEEYDLE